MARLCRPLLVEVGAISQIRARPCSAVCRTAASFVWYVTVLTASMLAPKRVKTPPAVPFAARLAPPSTAAMTDNPPSAHRRQSSPAAADDPALLLPQPVLPAPHLRRATAAPARPACSAHAPTGPSSSPNRCRAGGAPAARLLSHLAMPASATILLRTVRCLPLPTRDRPSLVGV